MLYVWVVGSALLIVIIINTTDLLSLAIVFIFLKTVTFVEYRDI